MSLVHVVSCIHSVIYLPAVTLCRPAAVDTPLQVLCGVGWYCLQMWSAKSAVGVAGQRLCVLIVMFMQNCAWLQPSLLAAVLGLAPGD